MSRRSDAPSDRVRLRRSHERGIYEKQQIHDLLDQLPLAHVGYLVDGAPFVTPTFQWREGNRVYWHGSSASRMLRKGEAHDVCVTCSALDGYVMARSGFHHSVNYRSIMLLGKAEKVADAAAKEAHLKTFIEGLFPGRWDMLREMTSQELKATTILSMEIDEASAKVRSGGPVDDEEDYALPIWAGVIPVVQQVGTVEDDPRNLSGVEAPEHVRAFGLG
ncbi:MAG: pyridoxamine 5'-phosphate oxidase family protein [Pseudomonadota bacterium]